MIDIEKIIIGEVQKLDQDLSNLTISPYTLKEQDYYDSLAFFFIQNGFEKTKVINALKDSLMDIKAIYSLEMFANLVFSELQKEYDPVENDTRNEVKNKLGINSPYTITTTVIPIIVAAVLKKYWEMYYPRNIGESVYINNSTDEIEAFNEDLSYLNSIITDILEIIISLTYSKLISDNQAEL